MIHDLKVAIEFMDPLLTLSKTFEIRKNDRDFKVGDILRLREVNIVLEPTGRMICKRVLYVLKGWGVERGYVAMSLGFTNEGYAAETEVKS